MSDIPATMKAIVLESPGGVEKLQYSDSVPVPSLSPGQVLVKNKISGINFVDVYFRTGVYPSAAGYPTIIGQEAAGTVEKVFEPNPLGWKEGDRVVWIYTGGYAEYTAVPGRQLVKIDPEISDEDAAGSFLMGMTALSLVTEAYPVQRTQTVLVHAAAGGLGLLLCQILSNLGAVVIGTAGSEDKCAIAKKNGATHVINYKETNGLSWIEQVKQITNGEGPDVVFDSVGKDTWQGSFEVVKRKGKVIFIGSASGPVPPIPLELLSAKNVSVLRSTLRNYITTRSELEHYGNAVLEMVKYGKLKVKKHKVYRLEDITQAHNDLEGRNTTGKLLLAL